MPEELRCELATAAATAKPAVYCRHRYRDAALRQLPRSRSQPRPISPAVDMVKSSPPCSCMLNSHWRHCEAGFEPAMALRFRCASAQPPLSNRHRSTIVPMHVVVSHPPAACYAASHMPNASAVIRIHHVLRDSLSDPLAVSNVTTQ